MRASRISVIAVSLLFVLSVSGCYTKLMSPNEFVHTQRYQSKSTFADNSYAINYNQSCVTCHSRTELSERAEELEYYGVRTVHDGILLSAHLWEDSPVEQPIIIVPNPYWPNPYNPVTPWWAPPPTAVTIGSPASGDGNKPRTGGATRDGNRERDRSTPISTPTYSQPSTPAGGNAPAPSSPPPAVKVTPSTPPAQTSDSARSRESNDSSNSSNRTRSDGSSRDESGNRPR